MRLLIINHTRILNKPTRHSFQILFIQQARHDRDYLVHGVRVHCSLGHLLDSPFTSHAFCIRPTLIVSAPVMQCFLFGVFLMYISKYLLCLFVDINILQRFSLPQLKIMKNKHEHLRNSIDISR
mgnify:CR=1 FL=1